MTYIVSEQEKNYYRYRARLDYLREQASISRYHQGMVKETLNVVIETAEILSRHLQLTSVSSEREKIELELKTNIDKQELLKNQCEQFENEIFEFSKQQKELTKEYQLSKSTEREKELLAEIERLKALIETVKYFV